MLRAAASLVLPAFVVLACAANRGGPPPGGDGSDGIGDASDNVGPPTAQVFYAPGAPTNSATYFAGADDPTRAPSLVYPLDGVVVPPNLRELAVHFLSGAGNALFEITYRSPNVDVTVYTPCAALGAGCTYTPDDLVWGAVADRSRDGTSVTLRVRGSDGSTAGGPVGSSASQTLRFTSEDVHGGLYYWAASSGGIYRYDFGRRGQTAEPYYTPAEAGGGFCVGCHALSRDGTRIAVGLNVPAPAELRVLAVGTRSVLWSGGSNFMAFNADASLLVTSDGNSLVLHDGATGATIQDPLEASGTMPDFSPDGNTIVFSRPGSGCPFPGFCANPGVDQAGLRTMTRGASGWNPSASLVDFDGTNNNYYPSFSPDGQWVVFNRSTMNSFDAPDASAWLVPADGHLPPVELLRGTAGSASSWPKWAPFSGTLGGDPIYWLTFSSRRAYGLALADGQVAQIWVVAVSPAMAARGEDPSFPALWMPFQDISTGNHIPQWVETVDRMPCTTDGDCGNGEFCDPTGYCVPVIR